MQVKAENIHVCVSRQNANPDKPVFSFWLQTALCVQQDISYFVFLQFSYTSDCAYFIQQRTKENCAKQIAYDPIRLDISNFVADFRVFFIEIEQWS